MPQNKILIAFCAALLILSFSCKKDELTIIKPDNPDKIIEGPFKDNNFLSFNGAPCIVDITNNTIFFPIKDSQSSNFAVLVEYNSFGSDDLEINGKKIKNNSTFNFDGDILENPLDLKFRKNGRTVNYKLIFTTLPIIEIYGTEEIKNYPKSPNRFKIHDPNFVKNGWLNQCYELTAGIETRGRWSSQFEKKSFSIEFWKSYNNHDSKDLSVFDLRNDDDWILDAMFIDRSKMRNKISMELWKEMSSFSYKNKEPKAKNYIRGEYVEVFLNGKYHGLYHFTERIDRKQLKLKKTTNPANGGFLYKSLSWDGPAFKNYVEFDNTSSTWHGFEQKFPDPSDLISWDFLYNGVKLVVDGKSKELNDEIENYLEVDNLVDCFILLQIIFGTDNTGKNMYFAKYAKDKPFFMVPWDMDASWGGTYDGENDVPFDRITANNLYNTLLRSNPKNYVEKLMSRWSELRKSVITPQKLTNQFRKYEDQLLKSGAFQREKERWDSPDSTLEDQIDLIEEWINNRIGFLDYYFYSVFDKGDLTIQAPQK